MDTLIDNFTGLNKLAPEPLYQQIKQVMEHCIRNGEWRAGQKLPSENELVTALDVSRMTVNRAFRELTQQGLINRVHGRGSFVAERPRHASLIALDDIASEVSRNGRDYHAEVLELGNKPAEPNIAELMQVTPGTLLYFLRVVHFQDEQPIQLECRYVNPELVPEFIHQDFSRTTSTGYLLQQLRPDEMEHIVSAVVADKNTRDLLHIQQHQPCLELNRRTWVNQRVVTQVTLTYPGNRYQLGARYATDDYQQRRNGD